MSWKNLLLTVLALGIVGSLLASSVLAAPEAGDKSSGKQATLFDPFALQTVSVASTAAVSQTEVNLTRQSIRIPFRPDCRSAFRPAW